MRAASGKPFREWTGEVTQPSKAIICLKFQVSPEKNVQKGELDLSKTVVRKYSFQMLVTLQEREREAPNLQ